LRATEGVVHALPVAVWLAMLGLFSMLSFSVTSRRRELAIRIVLGATARNVIRSTAIMPLVLACIAGLVGIVGGVLAGRQKAEFLYHTRWADPGAIAFATMTLLVIAIIGISQPVWQALRLDPTITMREE
jgi:putative ABC transport system permease protein